MRLGVAAIGLAVLVAFLAVPAATAKPFVVVGMPTHVVASADPQGHVALSWSAPIAAPPRPTYDVLRDGLLVYSGPGTTFSDPGPAGSIYTISVVSQDAVGVPAVVSHGVGGFIVADDATLPYPYCWNIIDPIPSINWACLCPVPGLGCPLTP